MTGRRWGARRVQVAGGIVGAAVLAYAVVLLSHPLPADATVAVDDLGQLVAAGAAALACWFAGQQAKAPRVRWAWRLLAAATGAWAAGEASWSYDELLTGRAVPFPSLADAGFLLFPVLAAAALLLLPAGKQAVSRLLDLLDGLLIAGSLLVLTWATSLGAALDAGGATRLVTALSLAYPLGDLVVITLVLLVIGRVTGGRRVVLGLLAAGLVALAAADSTFVYLTSTGSYSSGDVCDLGWVAGFALVALGAVVATTPTSPVAADRLRVPSWLRLGLPYLPVFLAETLLTGQLLAGRRRVPAPELLLGLGLVVLVLARQFLALADNRRLLVELHAEREHARHQAMHDPLTGLANRTLFSNRVEHALAVRARDATSTSVLFCDLDDFKTINDELGHAAGDALLLAVSDRLRGCLRPGDTVARLGGDEFAVLIEQPVEPPALIAARLVEALAKPLALAGSDVTITASVGLATAGAVVALGFGADELLRRADVAMYAAKAKGKATWVVYEPALSTGQRRGQPPPQRAAAASS